MLCGCRKVVNTFQYHNNQQLINCFAFFNSKSSKVHDNVKTHSKLIAGIEPKSITQDKWWEESFSNHPGRCNLKAVRLPKRFEDSVTVFLKGYNMEIVGAVAQKLKSFLFGRRVGLNMKMKRQNKHSVTKEEVDFSTAKAKHLFKSLNPHLSPPPEINTTNKSLFEKSFAECVEEKPDLKHCVKTDFDKEYNWKLVRYDECNAVAFLLSRSAGCYASSLHVLSEIKNRIPDFKPISILDFGSGTGTSTWAANSLWDNSLKQYVCVDSSKHMNQLSFYLFSGGNYDQNLPGLFIRQNLPIAFSSTYDIVIASYSLSEFATSKDREITLKLLWKKTNKFLVLIEHGNFQGHYIMLEARNLIARSISGFAKQSSAVTTQQFEKGKIFAPCPHDYECPMQNIQSSCTFEQKYHIPQYAGRFNNVGRERFSYMVLEKVTSKTGDATYGSSKWPRVVKEPQRRKNCIHCHLCTHQGNIENVNVSRSSAPSVLRHIVSKSRLGDLMPITEKSLPQG